MALTAVVIAVVSLGYLSATAAATGDGRVSFCDPSAESLYSAGIGVTLINETVEIPLSYWSGKVLLIVNVASFCDFTYQYLDLNKLKNLRSFQGNLEILAVPSNQFGLQEPGINEYEIRNSLKYVRPGYGYEPNFELSKKSDVNGKNELPLYTMLKQYCPAVKVDIGDPARRFWTPFRNNDITWNFNKFLIGGNGKPLKRYDSEVEPLELVDDIQAAISQHFQDTWSDLFNSWLD